MSASTWVSPSSATAARSTTSACCRPWRAWKWCCTTSIRRASPRQRASSPASPSGPDPAACSRSDIHAVVMATTASTARRARGHALEQGKDVLVEKPSRLRPLDRPGRPRVLAREPRASSWSPTPSVQLRGARMRSSRPRARPARFTTSTPVAPTSGLSARRLRALDLAPHDVSIFGHLLGARAGAGHGHGGSYLGPEAIDAVSRPSPTRQASSETSRVLGRHQQGARGGRRRQSRAALFDDLNDLEKLVSPKGHQPRRPITLR